jgi:tellurite resistance protein TerC
VFAILGLRAMYFLLAGSYAKFAYLKIGLAFVLGFVGCKMILSDIYPIPAGVSLGVIATILAASIAWSIRATQDPPAADP